MELIGVCISPGRIWSGHAAVPTVPLVYGAQEQPKRDSQPSYLPKDSCIRNPHPVYSNDMEFHGAQLLLARGFFLAGVHRANAAVGCQSCTLACYGFTG